MHAAEAIPRRLEILWIGIIRADSWTAPISVALIQAPEPRRPFRRPPRTVLQARPTTAS